MSAIRLNPPLLYKDVFGTVNVVAGISYYQGTTPQAPAGYTLVAAFIRSFQRPGTANATLTDFSNTQWFVSVYSPTAQGDLTVVARFVYGIAEAMP